MLVRFARAGSVTMLVMHVGRMRMGVPEPAVSMLMSVRFARRIVRRMRVLVM